VSALGTAIGRAAGEAARCVGRRVARGWTAFRGGFGADAGQAAFDWPLAIQLAFPWLLFLVLGGTELAVKHARRRH